MQQEGEKCILLNQTCYSLRYHNTLQHTNMEKYLSKFVLREALSAGEINIPIFKTGKNQKYTVILLPQGFFHLYSPAISWLNWWLRTLPRHVGLHLCYSWRTYASKIVVGLHFPSAVSSPSTGERSWTQQFMNTWRVTCLRKDDCISLGKYSFVLSC